MLYADTELPDLFSILLLIFEKLPCCFSQWLSYFVYSYCVLGFSVYSHSHQYLFSVFLCVCFVSSHTNRWYFIYIFFGDISVQVLCPFLIRFLLFQEFSLYFGYIIYSYCFGILGILVKNHLTVYTRVYFLSVQFHCGLCLSLCVVLYFLFLLSL